MQEFNFLLATWRIWRKTKILPMNTQYKAISGLCFVQPSADHANEEQVDYYGCSQR
jgi:hypothetical protein